MWTNGEGFEKRWEEADEFAWRSRYEKGSARDDEKEKQSNVSYQRIEKGQSDLSISGIAARQDYTKIRYGLAST